jgi:DNA-binding MarR family transcriptional regulator/GNAT superfamily N-acetyltransferase
LTKSTNVPRLSSMTARALSDPDDPIQAVRSFNRFYTRQIGVLQEHLLESQLSLTEVRVLYELAHCKNLTAVELRHELGLDRGYLSRMLRNFEKQGWIKTTPSPADRRRIFLSLTGKGRKVFDPLDRRSSEEVAAMLTRLSATQRNRLLGAMREMENVLVQSEKQIPRGLKPARNSKNNRPSFGTTGSRALPARNGIVKLPAPARRGAVPFQNTFSERNETSSASDRAARTGETPVAPLQGLKPRIIPRDFRGADSAALPRRSKVWESHESKGADRATQSFILRPHRPGDMGWVVQRHGELYWQEYRYDERFEALVAEIAAEFIQNLDPQRERCWIAERGGERLGTIFLVKKSQAAAKLRLLLVEPSARGLGIGKQLVSECVSFARQAGYKKTVLWTQSELHAARHLYEQAGFKRIEQKAHESWGRTDLVAETWELKL